MSKKLKVGDSVRYYCNSQMTLRDGVVTAIDVPVEWLWHWSERGFLIQSPHPKEGATHPLGVEIDGSLTRAYYSDGSGALDGYNKSRVQS